MEPKIYLGIDNCFASKRWTRPSEWMRLIRDLGLRYVEASADTECDPLYMGSDFMRDWIAEVRRQGPAHGIQVKNLYSGHGTYMTSGISHYDSRVTLRFRDQWMKKQMDTARALGAGFGFFAHGFEEQVLQDRALYEERLDQLYDTLADLAAYGREIGISYVGLEQMYSPHQPPWTIEGTRALLAAVWKRSKHAPFYITNDLGHMNGQQFFARPTESYIRENIARAATGAPARRVWMGSAHAYGLYTQACEGELAPDDAVVQILRDADEHPHLFAEPADWSVDEWLSRLGCYSPIVHLQQSDGKSSPHWPFSAAYMEAGIIHAAPVFKALARAYAAPDDPDMPPKCDEIVLTLEPFIGTAGNVYDLIQDLKESVEYWRRWVPRDGMLLSEIIAGL